MKKIICIVGSDGSGKSTLAKYVVDVLSQQGHKPVLVWSRYNHLFSKPLLAFARLMGRSPRETHEGVIFGYHYFNVWYLKWPFILLQCLDVNIVVRWQLWRSKNKGNVLVFERSPWDTLADVMLDVMEREKEYPASAKVMGLPLWIARGMVSTMRGAQVFLISRSVANIVASRPAMKHDQDLIRKLDIYEHLSFLFGWKKIDNNGALIEAKNSLIAEFSKM